MPRTGICLVEKWLASFSYMPHAVICLVIRQDRSLSYTPGAVIFVVLQRVGVSHTGPVSRRLSEGEYLLYAPF